MAWNVVNFHIKPEAAERALAVLGEEGRVKEAG